MKDTEKRELFPKKDEPWRITWKDTGEAGLPEHMVGTKYLRWMANRIGAGNPEKEWFFTKQLYPECAKAYKRADHRVVERACRMAIAKAGLSGYSTSELVYELAELAWERRAELGIPDEEESD